MVRLAGRSLRAEIEATTDRLAAEPFVSVTEAACRPAPGRPRAGGGGGVAVGVIRYPNPIGLPPL